MKFGEKLRELRKEKGLAQAELADIMKVSLRTLRGWEAEGRYPRSHDVYTRLAAALDCDPSYLMSEEENFIASVAGEYGARGAKQAQMIIDQTAAMFAGGELSDEDQIAFLNEIQALYLDSKKRAKKFARKEAPV